MTRCRERVTRTATGLGRNRCGQWWKKYRAEKLGDLRQVSRNQLPQNVQYQGLPPNAYKQSALGQLCLHPIKEASTGETTSSTTQIQG